jgi:general secretion pathway protein K
MTSAPRFTTRADAGFVLIAVLWMLAALATLASIYSAYAVNTAAASHIPDDRVQAEASILAGVELAVFSQHAVPKEARPPQGGFEIRLGHTAVAVRFRSEAARIDLNAAPPDLLTGLFVAVGVDPARAGTFADRIVGWRTKVASSDAAKEADLYVEQHMPYPPRQALFDNALELSLLPGLSAAVIERVLPFVTVFSGRSQIDVRTSDPTVLSALPGMTPEILSAVLKARTGDSGDGRDLLALLGPAKKDAGVNGSQALRTSIVVKFDNGRRVRAEVVIRLKTDGDEPYDLLYWRDDFDGPMQTA